MIGNIYMKVMEIFELIRDVKTHHNSLKVEDHYYSTATEQIESHSTGSRIGSSASITSTAFAILSNVTVVQPATGAAVHVVSTSDADDSAGTGVQQITIDYFTAPSGTIGWLKKSEVITMDGKTPVTSTNTDIYRIDRIHSNRVGSGGFPAGTITVKDTTDTLLYAQMDIGNNIFERAIFYIPKGYQVVLSDMMMGVSSNGGVIFRVFATEEDDSGNTVTIGQLSIEMNGPSAVDRSFNLPLVISNMNSKNKAIGIAVKSRTGTQTATATIRFHYQPVD